MRNSYIATGILSIFAVLASGNTGAAQVRIVDVGKGKTGLDFSRFQSDSSKTSSEFVQVLKTDLTRSGWFALTSAGSGVALKGGCRNSGNQISVDCAVQQDGRGTLLNRSYKSAATDVRRLAHQVADSIVKAVTGNNGMASARVVMVGTRSGKKELYMADSDGQGLKQMTQDKSVSVAPKWGPNNQIVYTSYMMGYPDVYLVDILSGGRDRISSYAGLNTGADISPDGRDIVLILSKDGNPELYVKNLRTGKLVRVTDTPGAAEASPSWAPDGNRIVYVSDSSGRPNLYITSRQGVRSKRITSSGSENVSPDWGPGDRIVYCTRDGGRYHIAVYDAASGVSKKISPLDGSDYEDPSWAPDGRHVACTRTVNYQAQVYILDTNGDEPIALTNYRGRGDWYSPSWSP
jgi:TolB protein